jgi:hypothetical protein
MEEDEYRSTYNELADIRCVFEKALTNHQAKCGLARHFCLADREGYSCENKNSADRCDEYLKKLRQNSTFVLKLHEIEGPLPHNMEIRVQAGGVLGLARQIDEQKSVKSPVVDDINRLLEQAQKKYGQLDALPYSEIIQSVVQFKGRRRRQRQ